MNNQEMKLLKELHIEEIRYYVVFWVVWNANENCNIDQTFWSANIIGFVC